MGQHDGPITLEQYAAISMALRSSPAEQTASVLDRHGLDSAAWEQAHSHWTSALEKDAEQGDGELLVRWAAARDAAADASPAPVLGPAAPSAEALHAKPTFMLNTPVVP